MTGRGRAVTEKKVLTVILMEIFWIQRHHQGAKMFKHSEQLFS